MYLRVIQVKDKKSVSHLWDGKDTICTMYSTQGLKVENCQLETTVKHSICKNCLNKRGTTNNASYKENI